MPKQVIVIMEDNYPFGECEECTNENTRVLVRKIYQVSVQERNRLLEKVNTLRKLKNEHMIKIESVLEEEESIHFLFQYIPIKLETWISNINDQFIENFRDQLIKFSSFLANNYIKIDFQLKNIGMDQNYGAKYFLDLNFEVDPSLNREKLKSTYIRQITNLFKPYIASSSPACAPDSDRPSNDFKANKQPSKNDPRKQQDTAISPPTNKLANKHKEKALEKYYQEVNMSVDSENEKILQEFMDVLDNEGEEQEPKAVAQSTIPSKSQSQFYPQANQFQKQNNSFHQQAQPQQQYYQQTNQNNSYQQPNQNNSYQQPNQNNNYQQSNQYQQNNQFQQANQYQQNQYQQQQQAQANQYQKSQANQYQAQQNQYEAQQNQYQTPPAVAQYAKPSNPTSAYSQGDFTKPINGSQSMGRGRSEVKESNEMWRESADLQNRVKNAIEKSMHVIKKFKAIKDNSLL